jgi:hypothetical protein
VGNNTDAAISVSTQKTKGKTSTYVPVTSTDTRRCIDRRIPDRGVSVDLDSVQLPVPVTVCTYGYEYSNSRNGISTSTGILPYGLLLYCTCMVQYGTCITIRYCGNPAVRDLLIPSRGYSPKLTVTGKIPKGKDDTRSINVYAITDWRNDIK